MSKSCSQVPPAPEDPIPSRPWGDRGTGGLLLCPQGKSSSEAGGCRGKNSFIYSRASKTQGYNMAQPSSAHGEGWAPGQGSAALDTWLGGGRSLLSTRAARTGIVTHLLSVSAGEWDHPRPWSLGPSDCRGLRTIKDGHFFKL